MPTDPHSDYTQGMQLALRGDIAGALPLFERSFAAAPDWLHVGLNLLDAYTTMGQLEKADLLAGELRERWPADPGVLASTAKLRERQGRLEEALAALSGPGGDVSASSGAYPLYLRLLIGAGWHQEALAAAEAGRDSRWRPYALVGHALALLGGGHTEPALAALRRVDPEVLARIAADWRDRWRHARVLDSVDRLVLEAAAAHPKNESLRILGGRATEG